MQFLFVMLFAIGADAKLECDTAHVIVALEKDQLRKLNAVDVQKIGRVSVAQAKDETAMLGEWTVSDKLTFTPRIPFERGTQYHVVVKDLVDATFKIAEKASEPGVVTNIYPQAEKLPANMLRFYIHFAGAMKAGQGYKHFRLLDDKGQAIPQAFLELDEELWNPEGTRLTLLLHPGRVKRELEPRKTLGPVLEHGKSYTLVIDKAYQTLDGKPLKEEFRKKFTTTASVEHGLDPAKWVVTKPKAATNNALELKFDALMDRALMSRVISVQDANGRTVEGEPTLDSDETHWRWKPKGDWKPGRYVIVANDVLEDVCGNRIGAAFDEVLGKVGARALKEPTKVPFQIE